METHDSPTESALTPDPSPKMGEGNVAFKGKGELNLLVAILVMLGLGGFLLHRISIQIPLPVVPPTPPFLFVFLGVILAIFSRRKELVFRLPAIARPPDVKRSRIPVEHPRFVFPYTLVWNSPETPTYSQASSLEGRGSNAVEQNPPDVSAKEQRSAFVFLGMSIGFLAIGGWMLASAAENGPVAPPAAFPFYLILLAALFVIRYRWKGLPFRLIRTSASGSAPSDKATAS